MLIIRFTNITFAYPWALALLALPIWLLIWYRKKYSRKTASIQLGSLKPSKNYRSIRPIMYRNLFVLRCFSIATLIIALARPQEKLKKEFTEGKGIDIMLCNDISVSMEALDFSPNRMEASRQIAQNFVRTRIGDRIGVVVFGSYPISLCPLTTDTGAVIAQLNTIKIGEYDNKHSLISSGLATCINRLKDSKIKSKIIILLSDGVSDEDIIPVDTVISLAQRYSIKIYTIGIGIKGEVPFLYTISDSTNNSIKSQTIEQRDFGFNEDFLKELANKTGGRYSFSKDIEALSEAFDAINKLEKSDIKMITQNIYIDKFLTLVYIGFLLLLIEIILRYSVLKKFP